VVGLNKIGEKIVLLIETGNNGKCEEESKKL
jgi:hypothetical protein